MNNDEKEYNKAIGQIIKHKRKMLFMLQKEIAELLQTSRVAICKIEKGTQKLTLYQAVKLEQIFEQRQREILNG